MTKRLFLLSFAVVLLLPFLSADQGTTRDRTLSQPAQPPSLSMQSQEGRDIPSADASPPEYHLRITLYPTVSLSRYDYNNDLNLSELRAYVTLRRDAPHGETVGDADISVNGQKLTFQEENYTVRIPVPKGEHLDSAIIKVTTSDGFSYSGSFHIPTWLRLSSPRPDIYPTGGDIPINWTFSSSSSCLVNIVAYDFKDRNARRIIERRDVPPDGTGVIIPADLIPPSTILRIFATQTWVFKQYLRDEGLVSGSEINIIPWSQVFIRTGNRDISRRDPGSD